MMCTTARLGRAKPHRNDGGQIAVVLAVVIALLAAAIIGLTIIGRAAIDRARAASAADAVALATAQSAPGGQEVAAWYRANGVEVTIDRGGTGDGSGSSASGQVRASSVVGETTRNPARATSFAEVRRGPISASPALVAVIARAEQLLGMPLAARYRSVHVAEIGAEHVDALRSIREPLKLCTTLLPTGQVTISICGAGS